MTGTHTLTDRLFTDLASGYGGADGIAFLRRVRHSKVMLLLTRALSQWPTRTPAADFLCQIQAAHPSTTAELLLYPWVGAWLARLAGRSWTPADDDYLAGVGIATALRVDESVPRSLWGTGPRLELPATGVSTMPSPEGLHGPHWTPVRRVEVGGGDTVVLDDLDRHRSCYGLPMADRLDPQRWGQWRDQLIRAFEVVAAGAPVRNAELRAGLLAIAPLAIDDRSHGRSVTHRYAFGAFAAGLPTSPEGLAATMIHEFQHSKLNAILDVVRLYDPHSAQTYFAPWRTDPRPIGALLHGTYAFAAVADFWDSLRAEKSVERLATTQAAHYRTQVHRALQELGGAPGLTGSGRRFVAVLSAETAARSRPLPPKAERKAARRLADTERAWQSQTG